MSDRLIRHTRRHPCERCGGYDELQRGLGIRCHGFTIGDVCFCTREQFAGNLTMHAASQTYAHRLTGRCACGVSHEGAAPMIDGPLERRHGNRVHGDLGRLVERYVYRDERSRPLHATLRYEPKAFLQQHYERGDWEWGLGEVRPVLYHLPELLQADPETPVFLTEGEKDCETLLAFGLVATTNPSGTSWRPHYGEWLRGRRVAIVEDNDEPGRARTAKVTRALTNVARSIAVVAFSSMQEHSDVSDWLRAGGNPRRLLEAVAS